jgi:hypothetical protein
VQQVRVQRGRTGPQRAAGTLPAAVRRRGARGVSEGVFARLSNRALQPASDAVRDLGSGVLRVGALRVRAGTLTHEPRTHVGRRRSRLNAIVRLPESPALGTVLPNPIGEGFF